MEWNENVKILSPPAVTVRRRVEEYLAQHPSATIIHLNESRVAMPLPALAVKAMKDAADEVALPHGMKLDSPWDGYPALKSAVSRRYTEMGIDVPESDIFVVSGMETAYFSLSFLFGENNTAVTTDPGNHVIWEVNRAAGRTLRFLRADAENAFKPMPDGREEDLIFLSSPHSVTGAAYTREELQKWVDFANENGSLIFFDASLSSFLDGEKYPRSIYEIDGAKKCAAELYSFESAFGVKELKIAYLVIPQALERAGERLQKLFSAAQPAAVTPPSFVMQKAAETLLSPEVRRETENTLHRLKEVSGTLSEELNKALLVHTGEETSPYLWVRCPDGFSSWQTFDLFLEKAGVVVVPGSRFGAGGEGYFRLTCYGDPEETGVAAAAIVKVLKERNEKAEQEAPQNPVDLFAEPEKEPEPGEGETIKTIQNEPAEPEKEKDIL